MSLNRHAYIVFNAFANIADFLRLSNCIYTAAILLLIAISYFHIDIKRVAISSKLCYNISTEAKTERAHHNISATENNSAGGNYADERNRRKRQTDSRIAHK